MLVDIENAAVAKLTAAGLNVNDIDLSDTGLASSKISAAQRAHLPAVFAAIEAGAYRKISQSTMRCEAKLLVAVAFKEVANDRKRRAGAHLILESVIGLLSLQTFDLSITPLAAERFYNITDDELADRGIVAYQIEFATSFDVQKQEDDAAEDLLRIGLNYYLQDPADDGTADAADEITLSEE